MNKLNSQLGNHQNKRQSLEDRNHPRNVLFGMRGELIQLPTCDHYSGLELLMKKSLRLQVESMQKLGVCAFDVTLDCEDGAPVGAEEEQASLVRELAVGAHQDAEYLSLNIKRRIGVRLHDVHSHFFINDVQGTLCAGGADVFSHIMIPKVESLVDVEKALLHIDQFPRKLGKMPLHVLLESEIAIHHAFAIAAHPRIESISFGLMDFISSHGGNIPASALNSDHASAENFSPGQFHHPLVVRAKLEIAAACHAYGKVPSHCVIRELHDTNIIRQSAKMAFRHFGFSRIWSIHPNQIIAIIEASQPDTAEIEMASNIILTAMTENWAPIALHGKLHDRASYRYSWYVLELAYKTGCPLNPSIHKLIMDAQQP